MSWSSKSGKPVPLRSTRHESRSSGFNRSMNTVANSRAPSRVHVSAPLELAFLDERPAAIGQVVGPRVRRAQGSPRDDRRTPRRAGGEADLDAEPAPPHACVGALTLAARELDLGARDQVGVGAEHVEERLA